MKVDREFSFEELPKGVRESLSKMVQQHVDQLVHDYNETLMAEGQYVEFESCITLVKKISDAAKVTVKISAKCDSDILALYHVYPQDAWQNKIQDFDTLAKAEDKFSPDERASLEEKDAVLYQKRKAAAKAVEEG